ncbi:MAG: STAS domain-containing protein [Candidatus Kapabacteria bacterium]|nr:STAS domain-containing protein [Ignavibacteriota bacterium]MCW5884471.1 STAS domain-containing protein [Candidatus Kapabacteria bacterium]
MSQVRLEEQMGGAILHLKGQFIGGAETDELKQHLQNLSEANHNSLIINLDNVTYLNSTALGVLISSHANFTKRGGKIILCNVSKSIENIFVITKLTLVFTIADTLEDAKKLF